jgi:hypothetical protein
MQEFDIGDRIRITATFTISDAPVDPDAFTITIQDALGTETEYTITDSGILHIGVGIYAIRYIAEKSGLCTVLWKSTGNIVTAGEDSFRVRYSAINHQPV